MGDVSAKHLPRWHLRLKCTEQPALGIPVAPYPGSTGCLPEAFPEVAHAPHARAVVVARRAGRRPGRLVALALRHILPSPRPDPGSGRPPRSGARRPRPRRGDARPSWRPMHLHRRTGPLSPQQGRRRPRQRLENRLRHRHGAAGSPAAAVDADAAASRRQRRVRMDRPDAGREEARQLRQLSRADLPRLGCQRPRPRFWRAPLPAPSSPPTCGSTDPKAPASASPATPRPSPTPC